MSELRAIMTVIVGLCALGVASSASPAVDHIAGVGVGVLFGLGALLVAAHVGREMWRELRFRLDMRAPNRRDAARLTTPAPADPRTVSGDRR